MEKLELISNIDIWLDMRYIRNMIVDDYLPEKITEIYQLVRGKFYDELILLKSKIQLLEQY